MEKRSIGYWNNLDNCIKECKKHNSLSRLKKDCHGCYVSLKRNHWENEVSFRDKKTREVRIYKQKPMGYWNNKENCFEEAKKYKTIYDLQRGNYGCYMGLKRNRWIYEAFPPKKGIKPMNYWNDKDRVLWVAKCCNTKMEFKKRFGGAFNAAIRYGWIDEACEYFNKTIKYADLNSRIHCVYVYEIKDLNACYIGRTSNLHNRDLSHRRGRKHHNGRITYDVLYEFCDSSKIEIPKPIIKEEELNGEESLIREDYWVKWYKDNGWNVLNKAKTGRLSGSLGAIKKWVYDTCKEFAKDYCYKNELKSANYSCYDACLKNGWFEEFGIKDKKANPNGKWNIKEKCIEEASKYSSRSEFIIKSMGAYRGAKRNGWLEEIYEIIDLNNKRKN